MPLATPVDPPPAADLDFADSPGVVVPAHARRGRRSRLRLIFVVALVLGGLGGVGYGVHYLVTHRDDDIPANPVGVLDPFNCALVPPPGWGHDRPLQNGMQVTYAMIRTGPDCHFALDVLDCEKDLGRYPGRSVLIETFKNSLDRILPDFAWQPRAPATVDRLEKQGTLAREPAYVLEFEGEREGKMYEGECFIVESRGYVYWLFTFAPASAGERKQAVRAEWDALRNGFSLLNRRENWQPKLRETKVYAVAGCEMTFAADVWKRVSDARTDPASDLTLQGYDPRTEKETGDSRAGKVAQLTVVRLPGKPDEADPGKALRDHFLARQVMELGARAEDVQLSVLHDNKGNKLEGPAEFGKTKGHLGKYRLTVTGGSLDRFVILATVPLGDGTLGVYAECAYKYREFWEQEVAEVLESYRGPE